MVINAATNSLLQTIGARLKAMRARLGKSQEEMAAAAGIPLDTYTKYEGDKRTPGGDALGGLGLMGVDLTWLLTGTGDDELALARPHGVHLAQQLHARYDAGDAFAMVPLYDVRAAAGHGALAEDREASEHWAFRREWLSQHVGIPADRLKLITVAGDSMEPDLHDGDVVMIDVGDVEVLREGVYVFALGGHVYVKRLRLQGDSLMMISRNGDLFPPREVSELQAHSEFRLIGRVVGQPTFRRF